jgi:hypothetical protein
MTLGILGAQLKPPIDRFYCCTIVNKCHPEYRLQEIAKVLNARVETLFPKTATEKTDDATAN